MKSFRPIILTFAVLGIILSSCTGRREGGNIPDPEIPKYLTVAERPEGGWTIVSVSPFDGSTDTLVIDHPLTNLIVMSTSHIGFLEELGRPDVISGVSGIDYIYSESSDSSADVEGGPDGETTATLGTLRGGTGAERSGASGGAERSEAVEPPAPPVDIGYEGSPDYERIVALRPDLVLTYSVSAAESPFRTKLKQLGIKTFIVNEHLESHPLARASYIKLFGALTGEMEAADSIFDAVSESYRAIADSVSKSGAAPRKVLLNIPYNDQWFVPSTDNYLTAMIRDAGGEVLGSKEGKAASSVMSLETAYSLGKEADCWLNVGWCHTVTQLLGVNPVFSDMLENIRKNASQRGFGESTVVWNDNRRVNAKGGNDIWQSGVVRPDLVLKDLACIFGGGNDNTIYYKPID